MAKSRASFLKQQRETAKKMQRKEKLQRKRDRKAAAAAGEQAGDETAHPAEGEEMPVTPSDADAT